MKKLFKGLFITFLLSAFTLVSAVADTDTTTLAAGATIGNVSSSAAFTAGAGSTVNGYVTPLRPLLSGQAPA